MRDQVDRVWHWRVGSGLGILDLAIWDDRLGGLHSAKKAHMIEGRQGGGIQQAEARLLARSDGAKRPTSSSTLVEPKEGGKRGVGRIPDQTKL